MQIIFKSAHNVNQLYLQFQITATKVLSRYFTQQGKGLTVFREYTDDQIIPYEQAFGDGGEEKLLCFRQKFPAQPGTV